VIDWADEDYCTAELKALPADIVWDEGMTAFARITRQALLSRRDGAKMVSGTYLTDASLLREQEAGLASMLAQGSPSPPQRRRTSCSTASSSASVSADAGRQAADRDQRLSARRPDGRADISPRRQNGLGSERGLAAPSPDGKGREPLSPVTVDDAAGTLRQAKTLL
jgi:hypothetical protein